VRAAATAAASQPGATLFSLDGNHAEPPRTPIWSGYRGDDRGNPQGDAALDRGGRFRAHSFAEQLSEAGAARLRLEIHAAVSTPARANQLPRTPSRSAASTASGTGGGPETPDRPRAAATRARSDRARPRAFLPNRTKIKGRALAVADVAASSCRHDERAALRHRTTEMTNGSTRRSVSSNSSARANAHRGGEGRGRGSRIEEMQLAAAARKHTGCLTLEHHGYETIAWIEDQCVQRALGARAVGRGICVEWKLKEV